MIVCVSCGLELIESKTCPECQQTHCYNCASDQNCPTCNNKTINTEIKQQRYGPNIVQWVSANGKKIGLAKEYDEIPQIALTIFKISLAPSSEYDILLFPSKRKSRAFVRKLIGKVSEDTLIVGTPKETPPDTSRYTVIRKPQQENFSVLLNVAAIRESSLPFLILFFNGQFSNLKEISAVSEKTMNSIGECLFKSVGYYNSKYGIKFMYAHENTRQMANNLHAKLWWSYAEYLTLRELSTDHSLSTGISTYISHKIKGIFDLTRNTKFYSLNDMVNLAGVHADALNIVFSLSERPHLFRVALRKFQRESKKVVKRLAKKDDIVTALDRFIQKMSSRHIHKDYESFVSATCRNFTHFISSLKPTYVWLEEIYSLAKITDSYLRQIEERLEPWHPSFGNINSFVKLLSDIFKRIDEYPEIYPEIPLIAGYMLLQLLEYLTEWKREQHARAMLKKALEVGKKLSVALEKTLAEIKKKNPESLFRYDDAATILLGLASLCLKFGKKELTKDLHNKAKLVAGRHNLQEIEFLLNWQAFILDQDYGKLLQAYGMYTAISSADVMNLEPQFRTIALLSAGVFESEKKFIHYQKAIEYSMELSSDIALSHKTTLLRDIIIGRIAYYVTNLFFLIDKAVSQETSSEMETTLNKAMTYANALDAEIGAPFDPMFVFVLKTRILSNLLNSDLENAIRWTKKLDRFSTESATTRNFVNMARACSQAVRSLRWKRLVEALDLPYEKRDPWSNLLVKIIASKSKQQLTQRLKLFAKSILFVEGPTEEVFIPQYAKKMGINLDKAGIGIIPLRGSSKGKYHLRFWKEISLCTPTPLFMLLDRDAREQAEAAIRSGLIERSHCFILTEGSIEDYYHIDVLNEVIESLCGKRPLKKDLAGNRVLAIDGFLKKNGYSSDWKITVGEKVARGTSKNQMHPEIKKILEKIMLSND